MFLKRRDSYVVFVFHNAERKQVGNKRVLIQPALLNVQVTSSWGLAVVVKIILLKKFLPIVYLTFAICFC